MFLVNFTKDDTPLQVSVEYLEPSRTFAMKHFFGIS